MTKLLEHAINAATSLSKTGQDILARHILEEAERMAKIEKDTATLETQLTPKQIAGVKEALSSHDSVPEEVVAATYAKHGA